RLICPNRRVSSAYSMLPVFCDENASLDSMLMSPIQTATGHHARTRLGRAGNNRFSLADNRLSDNRPSPSLHRVVRSFAGDHHVVHMALAQAGGADAHEARPLLQVAHGLTAAIAHARPEPAHHL